MSGLLDTINPWRILTAVVVGLGLIALLGDVQGVLEARTNARIAEARSQVILQINEATKARFAKHRADRDSLTQALEAAESLNGELVAALAIRIPADTVYVPINPVETSFDTTSVGIDRYASISDTTDLGIQVDIEAHAPADQSLPLNLGYNLFLEEQRPEIAFIRNPEGVYVSVSWLNRTFEVESPYYQPPVENQKPLRLNAGALVTSPLQADSLDARIDLFLELEYKPDLLSSITVPVGWTQGGFYAGLGLKKNLLAYDGLWDLLNPF